MVHRPVVPDGQIVDILPPVADLQVVVLDDELDEPVEEVLRLGLAQPVDLLDVVAHGEDALPARHGVRADDGVDRLEELAHVLGGAPLGAVQLEAVALSRLVEARLGVGCREGVEEALQGLRDAVVDLVAGCPEGVWLVERLLVRSGRFVKLIQ